MFNDCCELALDLYLLLNVRFHVSVAADWLYDAD